MRFDTQHWPRHSARCPPHLVSWNVWRVSQQLLGRQSSGLTPRSWHCPSWVIRDRGGRSHTTAHVRFAPKADNYQIVSRCPLCAKSDRMQRSKKLLDHLVGERKQLRWNFESERLGGLEVGDEFEFGRLHHRQIGGLGALEEAAGILADQTVGFGNA